LRACSFMLIEDNRASFVDNNTVFAVPYILKALQEHTIPTENVDYLIVTHVHLDHAGGTFALLKHCPNAKVIAHPKTAKFLAKPERLIEGARAVYGEPLFTQLFGEIEPVPEDRIQIVADEETLKWGERRFRFMHTLGHATHHICIYDDKTNGVFTGDSFGLGQSDPQTYETQFMIVSTAPADFDPIEEEKTIRRIVSLNPDYVFLPHYGIHRNPLHSSTFLLRSLSAMNVIMQTALDKNVPDEKLMDWLYPRVVEATREQIEWCGVQDVELAMNWLGDDPRINAMGLMTAIQKKRAGK
ncbi:MAG: MBL fold metallo-hydrolase, partial [Candidatus Hydrogenedens sp.]